MVLSDQNGGKARSGIFYLRSEMLPWWASGNCEASAFRAPSGVHLCDSGCI